LVRRLVADRGWTETAVSAGVLSRWDQIVGADIADHAAPQSLRDGELVLVAESTAWATQLRLLLPTIQARIAAEVGAGVVKRIRVHGPAAPSWRKGPRRVVGRGPRDTYG
jgi:predicted nucleic acid-binding Zn ribbon protein